MTEPQKKYGWVIVIIAVLSLMISNGLAIGGLPPFFKPIREEFVAIGAIDPSWAETFIGNSANITFLISGISSLIGGWFISRSGLRPVMLLGCVLLGGGLLVFSASLGDVQVGLGEHIATLERSEGQLSQRVSALSLQLAAARDLASGAPFEGQLRGMRERRAVSDCKG